MNENLNKVLNKIIGEEDLAKEFCQLDDMDEMYKYCYELGEGYTEEEFDEDIAEMINALQLEGEKTELSDKDLDYIAGGVNISGMVSKTTAIVLSALTIGSVMPTTNAMAAGAFQSTGGTQSISDKLKSEISDKWSKTKQALSNLWKNHKGMVIGFTVATAAVAGGVVIAKHHKTVVERQHQREEAERQREEVSRIKAARQREMDTLVAGRPLVRDAKEELAANRRIKEEAEAARQREEAEAARQRSQEISKKIQEKEKQIRTLESERKDLGAAISARRKVKAHNADGSGAAKQKVINDLGAKKRATDDKVAKLRREIDGLRSELDALPK